MKMYEWEDNAKEYLTEAGYILIRRASDITKDLSDEHVNRIYITLEISRDEIPRLSIEKEYIPIEDVAERGWLNEKEDIIIFRSVVYEYVVHWNTVLCKELQEILY